MSCRGFGEGKGQSLEEVTPNIGPPSDNKAVAGFGRLRRPPTQPATSTVRNRTGSAVTRTAVFQQAGLGRFGNRWSVSRNRNGSRVTVEYRDDEHRE